MNSRVDIQVNKNPKTPMTKKGKFVSPGTSMNQLHNSMSARSNGSRTKSPIQTFNEEPNEDTQFPSKK